MMRLSFVVGCALLATVQAGAQERGGEEAAAVRRRSEQYAAAVLKKNATALNRLLADAYSQSGFQLPEDKKGAISYFTEPRRTFAFFKTAGVRIRVDGDTAIETGEVHASGTEYGGTFNWAGIKYSRVWLKRDGVWHVIHEHRG
jgi:ketosteroid isomerase-like protein